MWDQTTKCNNLFSIRILRLHRNDKRFRVDKFEDSVQKLIMSLAPKSQRRLEETEGKRLLRVSAPR